MYYLELLIILIPVYRMTRILLCFSLLLFCGMAAGESPGLSDESSQKWDHSQNLNVNDVDSFDVDFGSLLLGVNPFNFAIDYFTAKPFSLLMQSKGQYSRYHQHIRAPPQF